MTDTPESIEDISPHKLLRNFSSNRLLWCLCLAAALHVVAIGGLSTDYVYRTWINPADDAEDTEAGATAADDPQQDAAGKQPAKPAAGADPDGKADASVVNRVTEEADPEEIPDEPGGLGISIDDTKQ